MEEDLYRSPNTVRPPNGQYRTVRGKQQRLLFDFLMWVTFSVRKHRNKQEVKDSVLSFSRIQQCPTAQFLAASLFFVLIIVVIIIIINFYLFPPGKFSVVCVYLGSV